MITSINELQFRFSENNEPVNFRFYNTGEGQVIASKRLNNQYKQDLFAFKEEITPTIQEFINEYEQSLVFVVNELLDLYNSELSIFKELNSNEKYIKLKSVVLFLVKNYDTGLSLENIRTVLDNIDSNKIFI